MVGITGFGSYVPRYRLPREVIAREWGHASLGGEKAVANHLIMTDCDADEVAIDLPVELTFRKYHEGSGLNNYFWKARPV